MSAPRGIGNSMPSETWLNSTLLSLGGRVGPPAADALALLAVPASFANDPQESASWDCEQPPSTGPVRASAAIRPRHGKRNSDTPTPHTPHRNHAPGLGPEW